MSLFDFERLVGFLTIATLVYIVGVVSSAQLRAYVKDHAAVFGLVISAGATLGSLALSELFDQAPCELCWYQRIFMYPLPVLIGIALVRNARDIRLGVIGLAALGSVVSVYHLIVQWVPGTGSCDLDNPCSSRILDFLGFVSTPAMALTAFIATAISVQLWRET
jgi:disulfide bond formation protein DsbB